MQQCHNDMQLLMLAKQQQARLGTGHLITPDTAMQPQEAALLSEQLIKDFRVMPMQVGLLPTFWLPSALCSTGGGGAQWLCHRFSDCTKCTNASMCALVLCKPGSCCLLLAGRLLYAHAA